METLKQYRQKYNYSFRKMAELLGISKTYYWQIENKKRRLSYNMAIKIALLFEQKPDTIFYEDSLKEALEKTVV